MLGTIQPTSFIRISDAQCTFDDLSEEAVTGNVSIAISTKQAALRFDSATTKAETLQLNISSRIEFADGRVNITCDEDNVGSLLLENCSVSNGDYQLETSKLELGIKECFLAQVKGATAELSGTLELRSRINNLVVKSNDFSAEVKRLENVNITMQKEKHGGYSIESDPIAIEGVSARVGNDVLQFRKLQLSAQAVNDLRHLKLNFQLAQ